MTKVYFWLLVAFYRAKNFLDDKIPYQDQFYMDKKKVINEVVKEFLCFFKPLNKVQLAITEG